MRPSADFSGRWSTSAGGTERNWYRHLPSILRARRASACGVVNAGLRRESVWRCGACGVTHDRNLNAARNLQKFALGAVGPDVTRPDSKALVRLVTDETIGDEGRTGSLVTVHPAAD